MFPCHFYTATNNQQTKVRESSQLSRHHRRSFSLLLWESLVWIRLALNWLCSRRWQTPDPPASPFQVAGLQACTTAQGGFSPAVRWGETAWSARRRIKRFGLLRALHPSPLVLYHTKRKLVKERAMGCLQGTVWNRAKEDANVRINEQMISTTKNCLFNKIPNSIL